MTLLGWVLLAAATAYAIKLAGYLLPQAWLDSPSVHDMAGSLTVGLLASLTVMNTLGSSSGGLSFDSRLLALAAGALALKLKAPYLVVVVAGAVAAALGRLAGLP
jgi:hypothetical protein